MNPTSASPLGPRATHPAPPLWQPVVLAALAGGMGWGIRGQYGHETGAMIAGLLVSLVLVFLMCPHAALLPAARAVAFGTIAIGIGGSMTYGQTIGLTQIPALIGNWQAWSWGMLGLAIKGAVWIGFAGLFLGMGLGGTRHSWRDMLLLLFGMFVLYGLGWWLLNQPFDPANKVLPRVYFSASWHWQPEAGPELKPRPEVWGGLLFALLGAWVWAGWVRRDRLARNLALWGMLGGIGFPLGQCLQSFHAWNREMFTSGLWAQLPAMNWWNWMETTFGAVMGACLGLGLWLNRRLIGELKEPVAASFNSAIEWLLIGIHVTLLIIGEFTEIAWANTLYDPGLIIAFIPLIAVAGGRWWPFMLALPITLVPIAGKTIRDLVYEHHVIGPVAGWTLYVIVPVLVTTAAAIWFARQSGSGFGGREFTRRVLLLNAWLYFGLNFAFFRFPWPWEKWTGRTPNALAFAICVVGLTIACLTLGRRGQQSQSPRAAEAAPLPS
ncbi:MAG: hypothetical protein KJ070_13265 [Verrucomicrobia bacterium]|nr:hypothetical protein [Verrucomicrobiota bacterium]